MDSKFMTREKWIEIARIVANAIVAIIAALTVTNCTATMSISKYNTSSPQQIEQTTNVDSTSFNVNLKWKKDGILYISACNLAVL